MQKKRKSVHYDVTNNASVGKKKKIFPNAKCGAEHFDPESPQKRRPQLIGKPLFFGLIKPIRTAAYFRVSTAFSRIIKALFCSHDWARQMTITRSMDSFAPRRKRLKVQIYLVLAFSKDYGH